MNRDTLLREDLIDEKVATGFVAGAFFFASVLAGAKLRVALFTLLAPALIALAIPHVWRAVVRALRARDAKISAE